MRRDYRTSYPSDMEEYIFNYGFHFNEKLWRFAIAMILGKEERDMKKSDWDRTMNKERLHEAMVANGIELKNDVGYDAAYVYAMAKSDFLNMSIPDEKHLLMFVRDYLDDEDGSETRAFDEFFVKTVALGIPIFWGDML